jgi:hypothetical protein
MFNAGQQIGGAVGLAVIGSVAWTVVNRHVRDSLSHVAAGHNLAGHAAAGPGSPIYDHALSSGVTTALTMGAGATVLALIGQPAGDVAQVAAKRVRSRRGRRRLPWHRARSAGLCR